MSSAHGQPLPIYDKLIRRSMDLECVPHEPVQHAQGARANIRDTHTHKRSTLAVPTSRCCINNSNIDLPGLWASWAWGRGATFALMLATPHFFCLRPALLPIIETLCAIKQVW